jgi:hypothetical protein
MDTAALVAEQAAALNQYGSAMTLRRLPTTDVTVQGVSRGYVVSEIHGGVKQGDRQVIISSAEITTAAWPGPPRGGDQMIIGGRLHQVVSADSATVAGVDIRYTIHVRGAA